MQNPIREKLVEWLAESLLLEREKVSALLGLPPSDEMSDYAFPCFTLASRLRKSPFRHRTDTLCGISLQNPNSAHAVLGRLFQTAPEQRHRARSKPRGCGRPMQSRGTAQSCLWVDRPVWGV